MEEQSGERRSGLVPNTANDVAADSEYCRMSLLHSPNFLLVTLFVMIIVILPYFQEDIITNITIIRSDSEKATCQELVSCHSGICATL